MWVYKSMILIFALILLCEYSFAQTWQEITPTGGNTPDARRNSAAIYDPVSHRMILFAGKAASGDQNDVWVFDLNTNLWSDITPASGPAPAPRFTPNAVYNPENQQMIIWSGQGVSFYNDVWAFDLTNESWSEFTPPDPKPNIRYGTAAVFDPLARDLVTFAGLWKTWPGLTPPLPRATH
jgi:hypothetical protein